MIHHIIAFSVCTNNKVSKSEFLAAFCDKKKIILIKKKGEKIEKDEINTQGKTNIAYLSFNQDGTILFYSSDSVKFKSLRVNTLGKRIYLTTRTKK